MRVTYMQYNQRKTIDIDKYNTKITT